MAKKRTARQTAERRARKPARKAAPRRRAETVAPPPDPIVSARGAEPPNRDGRQHVPANFHALYDRGFRAARGLPPAPAPAARAASASRRRMARTVPDLEIHYDETTQLPNMI